MSEYIAFVLGLICGLSFGFAVGFRLRARPLPPYTELS